MERMQSGAASHVLVLDIPLKDGDTLHFLRWLSRFRPDLPVVPLCCPDDAARVKEATGLGGEDVVCKPFDAEAPRIRHPPAPGSGGKRRCRHGQPDIEQLGRDTFFVSASLIMQKLRAQAALLAKTDVPVLIVGEAGVREVHGRQSDSQAFGTLGIQAAARELRGHAGGGCSKRNCSATIGLPVVTADQSGKICCRRKGYDLSRGNCGDARRSAIPVIAGFAKPTNYGPPAGSEASAPM